MHVVATAGHVDHGKSTLVRALTGTDPDRLAEEKRRGLTIDLGFAWTALPSGREVGFVDVPGHVRFLKNMLAGVGAVDACVFVVAATEGWKPQSEEHLRILELLAVDEGVVALTKVDAVDDGRRQRAGDEIAERVQGTFLAGAEVVEVAATAGRGIAELAGALDRLLARTPTAADVDRPRLWIDRAFAAKGSGTVVTGTLTGGPIAVGDELLLARRGTAVRVRALQTHDRALVTAAPGRRLGINLAGVSHRDVERGDVLVRPGQWHHTSVVDASLTVLGSVEHFVTRAGAYQAFVGSGAYPVQLRLLGGPASLAPGSVGAVRLRLPVALPVLPGDRYVLRESGRGETVGGGQILDVAPVLPAARAQPDRSVARVVRERGWVAADELSLLTGVAAVPDVGRWVVDPEVREAAATALAGRVDAAGPLGLDVAELDERERALLSTLDEVGVAGGRARRVTVADPLATHPYVAALEASPFAPPPPDGVDRAELRALVRRGLVVERDGIYFAPAAVAEAARRVARLLAAEPAGVSVGEARDALATSRKYLLPLLNLLDASGVTRRRDDVRIAGPRLPDVDG